MEILIINQPLNNRGDESAHKGLVRSIVKNMPDAHVTVLWVRGNKDSIRQFAVQDKRVDYVSLDSFPKFWSVGSRAVKWHASWLLKLHPTCRKVMSYYKRADYVVCAPGGICMGGFQSWSHLNYLHFAILLRKKLFYYGRSFGPFPTATKSNCQFKALSLEALNYFSFLSIRDKKSEMLAKELGVNYVETVDSAFLDDTQVEVPREVTDRIGTDNYVVFVPNLLIWHYAYRGRITKETVLEFFAKILKAIEKKYPQSRVVMLPQTFNYGTYDGDDIHFFEDLQQYTQDERIVIIPDTYSSDIQQKVISKAQCMVGARYHSVVFSLNQAVPFVALSYEHKISGLLETLGKTDCMVDITHGLDSPEAIDRTVQEFECVLARAQADKSARQKAKEIARGCFEKFMKAVRGE